MTQLIDEWKHIKDAPLDREVELKGKYIPSAFAAMNGAVEFETHGFGRALWKREGLPHEEWYWSGILGGNPTHFREKSDV